MTDLQRLRVQLIDWPAAVSKCSCISSWAHKGGLHANCAAWGRKSDCLPLFTCVGDMDTRLILSSVCSAPCTGCANPWHLASRPW